MRASESQNLKMTSFSTMISFALLVVLSVQVIQGTESSAVKAPCSSLPTSYCAFAVESSGARCLLETFTSNDLKTSYHCQTSDIMAAGKEEYIESDECVAACGVDRMTVGLSTDCFFSLDFAERLCSMECQKCSNIVDLFSNVVAAIRGGSLANFCYDLHANQGLRRDLRARQLAESPTSILADAPFAL